MIITSRSNQTVISAAALKEKKYRETERKFLIEGVKLMKEAVLSGIELSAVFATSDNAEMCRRAISEVEITEVSDSVFEKISTEKSPQGVICVAKYIDKIHNINKIYNMNDFDGDNRFLVLSSVRDPGNLGTVIRTAAAFGIDEIILSSDCADIYNPRTVRGAMGTLFKQRISYVSNLPAAVDQMSKCGYKVYAAVLDDKAVRLDELNVDRRTAFIIGNEGHGIARDVIEAAGNTVYIPMASGVESLNAGVAASVFMWESFRSKQ